MIRSLAGFTIGAMLSILPHTQAVAPTTTAPTPQVQPVAIVAPATMQAWTKVMECETGNWHYPGPYYQGGLGITPWNWVKFGGTEFAPTAYQATPAEQVFIAERIQGGNPVPDQAGSCHNW